MWYVIGVIGLLCVAGGIKIVWGGLASKKWPTTQGRIVGSDIQNQPLAFPDGRKTCRFFPVPIFECRGKFAKLNAKEKFHHQGTREAVDMVRLRGCCLKHRPPEPVLGHASVGRTAAIDASSTGMDACAAGSAAFFHGSARRWPV